MTKKTGIIFLAIGAVCILLALSLLFYNQGEDAEIGQATESLLEDVKTTIFAPKPEVPTPEAPAPESPQAPKQELTTQDPVVYLDGLDYMGYLSIPALDLALPIIHQWDYNKLKLAPCRHSGSIEENNLVIAGHNYKSHFGSLGKLQPGNLLSIFDANGAEHTYEVLKLETMAATAVEEVLNSDYDLVLYTCTLSGQSRVIVFCNKIPQNLSVLGDFVSPSFENPETPDSFTLYFWTF